jgi:hypothetical protein
MFCTTVPKEEPLFVEYTLWTITMILNKITPIKTLLIHKIILLLLFPHSIITSTLSLWWSKKTPMLNTSPKILNGKKYSLIIKENPYKNWIKKKKNNLLIDKILKNYNINHSVEKHLLEDSVIKLSLKIIKDYSVLVIWISNNNKMIKLRRHRLILLIMIFKSL